MLPIFIGLFLIILVIIISFARPYIFPSKEEVVVKKTSGTGEKENKSKQILSKDLADKIAKNEELTVIDIRDMETFYAEHIIDSLNVPSSDLAEAIASLDKNKTYVFVDDVQDPQISELVGKVLPENGINNAYYLVGGFYAWRNQGNRTISDGDPTSFTEQSKVKYIKTDDLKKMLDENQDIYIIDVRKPNAFSEGHIKNAVNIFLNDLEKKRNDLPMGKKIVVYDNDGLWAFKAATRLFDLGVFNVVALSDGFNAWKEKQWEVVK